MNNSFVFYQYNYPKAGDIVSQQQNYIQTYINNFETVLNSSNFADPVNGYRKYIGVNSFIDYFNLYESGFLLSSFKMKRKIIRQQVIPTVNPKILMIENTFCFRKFINPSKR